MSRTGIAEWFAGVMEWSAGVVDWFAALPVFTQIFFGLFLFTMAIPIATLTVLQFIESLRILRGASSRGKNEPDNDKE